MKALKIVFVAMLFVVALSASAFADKYGAELCWNLDDGKTSEVFFLRVGVLDFGTGDYGLAGTKSATTRTNTSTATAVQIAKGNLTYSSMGYMVGLQVSDGIAGSNTLLVENMVMMLDSSFNGYYFRANGTERRFTGVATFALCP
ncbi:hypothetical protein [Candidatus Magnetominusculus xianensis]|uniref:Secreted protein n=1 Tax=Candidatus Magnetominusculus xianensis TaxID=1748249 RepID=A0ABR5SJZ6_9BACT|nr:hypothetical protein [Candidatus Magnetominusculus xianensis]KWT92850.1 hypothetical protein ASN18_0436 [Candidatus Magnetominusculus xianensis]MBF0403439.1 hypothetical protein [Nitrospirota bacterium]